MLRVRSSLRIATVLETVLAVLLVGCAERSPTGTDTDSSATAASAELSARVVISAPFSRLDAANIPAFGPAGTGAAAEVAYVSLPPGSVDADSATISNLSTRQQISVALIDGGFDPVAIAATAGDELAIVLRAHANELAMSKTTVPRRRPPSIVRTDPPKGKTDVPLNTQITIVFNEPIDRSSLAGSVQLIQGERAIAGAVSLTPSGIVADFVPDAPLTAVTSYELVVTTGVRNSSGEQLDTELHVSFTTGTKLATSAAALDVSDVPNSVTAGIPVTISVTARDATGRIATGYEGTVHIASTDPTALLPSDHVFAANENGKYTFAATFQTSGTQTLTATDASVNTLKGSATFTVTPPLPTGAPSIAVTGFPGAVAIGQPLAFAVTVKSASGNDAQDYTGTLHFASTDPLAQLPPDYTFVAADHGIHVFTSTFESAGNQTMSVTDASSSIRGGAAVDVATVNGFAAISAGVVSSCGLSTSGAAYCWGTNDLGRIGDGTTQDNLSPVPVSGALHFSALRAASLQICGLATDGAAYCWGSNLFGALGSGTTSAPQMCYSSDWADEGVGNQPCSPSPTPVSGGLRFVALSSGLTTATCALTADGAAYCWGYNRDDELGSGSTTPCYNSADSATYVPSTPNHACSAVPLPVSGGLHFSSISSGGYHSCGVTTAATVYCWGYNQYGELGDGGTTNRRVPVPVATTLRFVAITTGGFHSCGLTIDGLAYCWGSNGLGELGNGTTTYSSVPVPVAGGRRFTLLTTGSSHTCGLTTSGDAYCWGENGGAFGDGTMANSTRPVPVAAGLRFLSLNAGSRHTCGVTAEGTYCWGANDYGQFGDGTLTSSIVPVKAGVRP